MAELNLKQITDKLNNEFIGEVRKLVFWYDDNAEFAEDVDSLELVNAKVLHLETDNQFYTKYFLECVDNTTNYLVYAPFPKPALKDNHLADTIRYSMEFCADRVSLLMLDLNLPEHCKPVIQEYIKFFREKKRTQAFYNLGLEIYNRNTIEIGMMSILCKCKTSSYEEVLRTVLTESDFDENLYLVEFKKYNLLDAFWRLTSEVLGYSDAIPTLEKLAISMFIIYLERTLDCELPISWDNYARNMVVGYTTTIEEYLKNPEKEKEYRVYKTGNCMSFMDNLMNNTQYSNKFDLISARVYDTLKADVEFKKMEPETLVSCGIFSGIEDILIQSMIDRLEVEDIVAKLGEYTIPQLVKMRRQGHYGRRYRSEYFVLENAWHIISNMHYEKSGSLNDLVKKYTDSLYHIDRRYRYFYFYLDKLEDGSKFSKLRSLIENIYTNEYLTKVCVNWTELFQKEYDSLQIGKQSEFYSKNIQFTKEQTVVIISDALRYEVGASLLEKLQADEKIKATMKPMMGILPSITKYGMAALLPHKTLELTADYDVLVDGNKTGSTEQKQAILQQYKPNSKAILYKDIKNASVTDLKNIFAYQDVVYIYHNQIDGRGDEASTEHEVFNACEEAVDEIHNMIRRLTSANKSNFIITADHGFIYKRDNLEESDKIGSVYSSDAFVGRRYYVAEKELGVVGTSFTEADKLFKQGNGKVISYPIGADIFKKPGSGVNYVHGGCSPHEMLIPLIEVKTERGYKDVSTVQIELVSLMNKITNLITTLDFVQKDPISDLVKETTYRLYFITEKGEKISNEQVYVADKKEKDSVDRVFKLRFNFKNRKYDRSEKCYLVAYDDKNALETMRHEVIMDIMFADDFGFGF